MPRELVAVAPGMPALRDYEEPALGPSQIRIRTEFASPKHGTELVFYREREPGARYDPEIGAMMPPRTRPDRPRFPMRLGNMAVGVVTEIGPEVTRFRPGDQVFGHLPIRETHTVDQSAVDPLPEGLTPEAAVCLDPAVMSLVIRDAPVTLGDKVAIFGLGAIGLMALQWARLAGAAQVIGVDLIPARRELAQTLGADITLDPRAGEGDVGLEIRRLTGPTPTPETERPRAVRVLGGYWEVPTQHYQQGVDVAVEVSGSTRALHDAIRATRYGGTVCVLSFYSGEAAGLRLGDEFHINRLQLVSARAESLPLRGAPGWTFQRLVEVSLDALTSGRLRTGGIVTPIVSFEEAADAYRSIDERPAESIKLGIRFS